MATLHRSECARLVDSSPRATNHVAWNAADRSNQLKLYMNIAGLRAGFVRVVSGGLNDVPVGARTEAAGHFKHPYTGLFGHRQLKYS